MSINGIRDKIFFPSVSAYHGVLAKNNAGKRFFNFFNFLLFFSEFSSRGWVWTEIGTKFFFLSFSAYLLPFWLKVILERDFLIFWFFLLFFFCNFHALVGNEQSSGLKIFSLFLDLSHPVLAKNNARKRFFNFLNFFAIFFGIFFPRSSMNGIQD